MSTTPTTRFCTDYAKRVSKCQKCKMQLEKGILRMGKIVPNYFVAAKDSSKPPPDMKQYFHKNCLFEMLFKARPTTKVIDETEEIEGFEDLNAEDQDEISKLVDELTEKRKKDGPAEPKTPKKPVAKKTEEESSRKRKNDEKTPKSTKPTEFNEESPFNSFHKFVHVCSVIRELSDLSEKSSAISTMLKKKDFDGDVKLWLTFLIREADSRQYNLSNEQLIKYFSKILATDEAKIQKYFTKSSDVALSISHAHEKKVKNEKSGWSLQKVDRYLEKLAGLEDDDARLTHLKFAAKRMRNDELEVLLRLVVKNLDNEADAKVILNGVGEKAFEVFQRDGIEKVVDGYYEGEFSGKKTSSKKSEPKAKKSKRDKDSDDDEESDGEMSNSEDEEDDDHGSDSEDDDDEDISGSDSDDVSEISSEEDDEDEEGDFKENSPKKSVPRGTRTRPRGNDGKLVKKEECPIDMEECRYGKDCYRKNKEHQQRFWHPTGTD